MDPGYLVRADPSKGSAGRLKTLKALSFRCSLSELEYMLCRQYNLDGRQDSPLYSQQALSMTSHGSLRIAESFYVAFGAEKQYWKRHATIQCQTKQRDL